MQNHLRNFIREINNSLHHREVTQLSRLHQVQSLHQTDPRHRRHQLLTEQKKEVHQISRRINQMYNKIQGITQ